MSSEQPKTVMEILQASTKFLEQKRVENPGLACELLVSRLLKCRRLDLYLRHDQVLGEKLLEAMRRGLKRVAAGEPVQYVLGQWDFMGHTFRVDSRALIPRPETEILVETVLACEPLWSRPRPAVVDVGTGSGCIVISLALARSQGLYMAVDPSVEALSLARENAEALGVADRIAFTDRDVSDFAEPETLDAVVSNPPYIPTRDCDALPVHIREHEPRSALDGGDDGMRIISDVINDAGIILKPGGFLFLEVGDGQADSAVEILQAVGFIDARTRKDLGGRDRIVVARLSP